MAVAANRGTTPVRSNRFLSMTLFRLPLEAVDNTVRRVLERIGKRMSRLVLPLDVYDLYEVEPPSGGAHLHRFVLYEPSNARGTTALMTNLRDGWNSLSDLLANEHLKLQVQVISTSEDAEYPQQFFQIWSNGRSDRTVMLMRDSERWIFEERGSPRDFEFTASYAVLPKRKRLTRDMLISYLGALGWDIGGSDFWNSERNAIQYEQTGQRFLH